MEHNALARQFGAASLLRFALPNMVMMVFMSLYTIVDGICISRFVGTLALSAINMSYPLNSIEMGVGIMLGTGGSAVIARKLGEGKEDAARRDFTCITAVAAGVGLLFLAVCLALLDPILALLGTSPAQMDLCRDYTRALLLFSPMLMLQMVFQMLFITAGKPGLGLGVTMLGGLANVVLDFTFMGVFGWGVTGAAVATGMSYSIPALAGLWYFAKARPGSSLRFAPFRMDRRMLLQTCGNGSSEMVSNIANAVTTFLFNWLFLRFQGEDGVAAITIVMYFQFVFSAVFLGFSMGVAPVFSYKYGAQDTDQLRHVFRCSMGFTVLCSVAAWALSRLTIAAGLAVFTDPGSHVFELVQQGFPVYAVSFLFMGVSLFASGLFTAFSNGTVSAVISFARTLVFLVGMLLVLPSLLGEPGIWLAVPAAEGLGLLVSIGFLVWGRKQYQY